MLPANASFTRLDTTSRLAARQTAVDLERKLPKGTGSTAVIDQALACTGAQFPGGLREAGRRA